MIEAFPEKSFRVVYCRSTSRRCRWACRRESLRGVTTSPPGSASCCASRVRCCASPRWVGWVGLLQQITQVLHLPCIQVAAGHAARSWQSWPLVLKSYRLLCSHETAAGLNLYAAGSDSYSSMGCRLHCW